VIKYVLPKERADKFDLVEIKKDGENLHLYLDELNVILESYAHLGLSGNGLIRFCSSCNAYMIAFPSVPVSIDFARMV
jgi:hypothetical protein